MEARTTRDILIAKGTVFIFVREDDPINDADIENSNAVFNIRCGDRDVFQFVTNIERDGLLEVLPQ